LKPERWGIIVQGRYPGEKACDKRQRIIIIIIIIIITTKSRNYRKQPYWALHTYFGKS
jgi:hypothetical protein